MSGSLKIAQLFGIDLKIHWSFLFIVLIAFANGGGSLQATLFFLAMILLVFVCVTLHEFGHALMARRFKIPVREIVLLPIGGVALMSRIPEKPRQELLIAAAGPLVNVAILAVLLPIWFLQGGTLEMLWPPRSILSVDNNMTVFGAVLAWLVYANGMLIAFNMVPAFPLDGGRMFRAILAMRMPHAKATRLAARVGQIAAIGFALYALATGQIFLLIIAFFIFMNAGAESAAAQTGTVLATRRVGDAYNKTAITLTIDDRVSTVIEHLLTSYQPDFAVLHRGNLSGIVTRSAVLKWLAETPSLYDVYVTEVMLEEPQVTRVDANLPLDAVVQVMNDQNVHVVAVYEADHYLGLVNSDDLLEAQAVLTFLNRRLAEGNVPPRSAWPVPMRAKESTEY